MTHYMEFENRMLPVHQVRAMQLGDAPPIRNWQERPTWRDRLRSMVSALGGKSTYVEGIDLSKWQGTWNPQKSIEAGTRYVFIKATQNNFTDSKFDEYSKQAADANLPAGYYHFADPAGRSAETQARYFADVVKGVGELSLVLDAEWTGGLGPSALNQWFYDFLGELGVHIPNRLKEIYTRVSWWDPNVAPASWADNYGLWAARWASWLEGPWSDGKFVPRDWSDWTNWQWSADGNGLGATYGVESNSIDLNYFNGGWVAFQEHYKLVETPPIPPTEPHEHPDMQAEIEKLQAEMIEVQTQTSKNSEEISDIWAELSVVNDRLTELEENGTGPIKDTIRVQAKPGQKAVVFELLDYDKACPGQEPPGKPIAEPPPIERRIVYKDNQPFEILAKAAISCKDNPDDHVVKGSGYDFGVVAQMYPGAGSFVRLDKINLL
jgi:GH25 family lysozyme M1 (1,4-beta-N-acetylmuramidase)